MDKKEFQIYPDKSRMIVSGQLYNCVDSDVDGLFRNSVNGDLILVGSYLFSDKASFYTQKWEIEKSYFQKIVPDEITEEELYELESDTLDIIHSDERLKGLIYPYFYEIQEDSENNTTILYTINEVPEGFGSKYKKFKNIINEPKFPINLRVAVISNLLELAIGLNERFGNDVQTINKDAVFISIENGDVKLLLEQQIAAQNDTVKSNTNEMLACMIFELLCMANPYDGKKTLVKFPLLTPKTLEIINKEEKAFIFANNENGISKYIAKDALARWNALPDAIKKILAENLDFNSSAVSYELNDWLFPIRNLRDFLVYVNGRFRFCNPVESRQVLFFKVEEYMVPVWPRKAIYGYHAGETDFAAAKQVLLGVNAEGKVENHSEKILTLELDGNREELRSGECFRPKSGIEIILENKRILIVNP